MKRMIKVLLCICILISCYASTSARGQNFDPAAISQVSKGLTDSKLLNQASNPSPQVASGKGDGAGMPGMTKGLIRDYYVFDPGSDLSRISKVNNEAKVMASMASKDNPANKVLLFGKNTEVIGAMQKGLPPGTGVVIINDYNPAMAFEKARELGINVVLGVRPPPDLSFKIKDPSNLKFDYSTDTPDKFKGLPAMLPLPIIKQDTKVLTPLPSSIPSGTIPGNTPNFSTIPNMSNQPIVTPSTIPTIPTLTPMPNTNIASPSIIRP
jgi:hypothetical protein